MESEESRRRLEAEETLATQVSRYSAEISRKEKETRAPSRFWIPWTLAAAAMLLLFVLGGIGDCAGL